MIPLYIVAWRLKAGIVEPEETSFTKQRLGKYFPPVTNTQATIEEFLESVFSVGSPPRLHNEDNPFASL
jgi:hypothetical protein